MNSFWCSFKLSLTALQFALRKRVARRTMYFASKILAWNVCFAKDLKYWRKKITLSATKFVSLLNGNDIYVQQLYNILEFGETSRFLFTGCQEGGKFSLVLFTGFPMRFEARFCPEGWRSHPGYTVVDETLEKMLFGQASFCAFCDGWLGRKKLFFGNDWASTKMLKIKCWGRISNHVCRPPCLRTLCSRKNGFLLLGPFCCAAKNPVTTAPRPPGGQTKKNNKNPRLREEIWKAEVCERKILWSARWMASAFFVGPLAAVSTAPARFHGRSGSPGTRSLTCWSRRVKFSHLAFWKRHEA